MVFLRSSTAVALCYAISTLLDYPKQVGREGQITANGFRSTFHDYIAERQSKTETMMSPLMWNDLNRISRF